MQVTLLKCDGKDCHHEAQNSETWLTIGSTNQKLYIKNNLPKHQNLKIEMHYDLHFCSKDCFVRYFFKLPKL